MKIKVGDIVVLISGTEKDMYNIDKKGVKTRKTGKVMKVLHKKEMVIVEGMNMIKKHQKAQRENETGKIVDTEAPIHISNVALVDPKTSLPTKVGYKSVNGIQVRYAKKSGELIDKTVAPKRSKKEDTKPLKDTKSKKEDAPVKEDIKPLKPVKESKLALNVSKKQSTKDTKNMHESKTAKVQKEVKKNRGDR